MRPIFFLAGGLVFVQGIRVDTCREEGVAFDTLVGRRAIARLLADRNATIPRRLNP